MCPTSEVTYVEVDTEATGDATPWPMPYAAKHAKQLQVPPYPDPLSHSPDPRAWWAAHRPLVLQTGALGPMENNQVSFSGFRLLSVKGDVIDKVHSISINRLEATATGSRWRTRSGLTHPAATATPTLAPAPRTRRPEQARRDQACPPRRVSNVTYRDTQDRLHELWKNDADSGTSNLTAPTAASDPSPYYDAADRQLVVVYRDTDGKSTACFWSTGPVGRNLLTPPRRAKAQGNPVGYLTAAGIHHVIYRSGDSHLHELYWAGAGAVGHRDLTKEASAPPATGDPSAYMDTRRGAAGRDLPGHRQPGLQPVLDTAQSTTASSPNRCTHPTRAATRRLLPARVRRAPGRLPGHRRPPLRAVLGREAP